VLTLELKQFILLAWGLLSSLFGVEFLLLFELFLIKFSGNSEHVASVHVSKHYSHSLKSKECGQQALNLSDEAHIVPLRRNQAKVVHSLYDLPTRDSNFLDGQERLNFKLEELSDKMQECLINKGERHPMLWVASLRLTHHLEGHYQFLFGRENRIGHKAV